MFLIDDSLPDKVQVYTMMNQRIVVVVVVDDGNMFNVEEIVAVLIPSFHTSISQD